MPHNRTFRCRSLLLSLLALLAAWLAPPAALADNGLPAPQSHLEGLERWYLVLWSGQRMGQGVLRLDRTDEGHWRQTIDVEFTIRRGPVSLSMSQHGEQVETEDGEPVRIVSEMNMGGGPASMAVRKTMTFPQGGNGPRVLITEQNGRLTEQRLAPARRAFLPPFAAQRAIRDQLNADASGFEINLLDIAQGTEPMTATYTVRGREPVELVGRSAPAVLVDVSYDALPGVASTEALDADGVPLRTTISLGPGMELTMVAADPDLVRAGFDPPELLASTLIAADRAIPDPLDTRRPRRYRVSWAQPPEGPAPAALDIPVTANQAVDARGDGSVILTVGPLASPPPHHAPDAVADFDAPTGRHLADSSTLRHSDPAVRELVRRAGVTALAPADIAALDPADPVGSLLQALQLAQFVRQNMASADLSVGLATAGEVARTLRGDCTEHAVLLAAMLRAAGIPSRCVSGLTYIDEFVGEDGRGRGVWVYHMWTQAWLHDPHSAAEGPRWIDLDAAMPARPPQGPVTLELSSAEAKGLTGFNNTHIALNVNAFADDAAVNPLVRMAPMMGNLKVEMQDPE